MRFDLNLLVALDALLSERNVTRAAERLFVTQPTMSGMLQRLREQFGDQLLVKQGRELELTPQARALAQPVREALEATRTALHTRAQFDPATSTRTFRLSLSDYATVTLLPAVLRRVLAQAPNIHIAVETINSPVKQLASNRAELCVCIDKWALFGEGEGDEALHTTWLFDDRWVCISDAGHPWHAAPSKEAFFGLPFAMAHLADRTSTLAETALRQWMPDRPPYVLLPNFTALAAVVAGSPLIGIVQHRLAQLIAGGLGLRSFEPPIEIPRLAEVLLWHGRNDDDPGHRWLREVIVQSARDLHPLD